MPAKGARCLTWDCPRNLAGPWRARGRGLPDAGQGRGSPGGCAGEVREDVQGRTSGRMPARGPLGGGPGPGVARKYSCNFLKVLQRVRASGRRRHGASPRPPAPPWTRSRRPRAGHGVSRAARSSPATARCGGPGTRDIRSRPLAPPREERPGHHQDPRSNHAVRRYALLPPRTPTPSTGSRAACGSRPTSSSTHPAPTRKPSGGAPTRPAGASTYGPAPHTRASCQPPTP